jgi:hypothetical protein
MNKIYGVIDLDKAQLETLRGAVNRNEETARINIDIEGKTVVFAVNGVVIFKGKL